MILNVSYLKVTLGVFWTFLGKDFKSRYKGSFLGYVWVVLMPMVQILIYYFLFKLVLKVQIPNFEAYLVVGIFTWSAMTVSIKASSLCFVANAATIKRLSFSKYLLVGSIVFNEFILLVINMIFALIILSVLGSVSVGLSWLYLPFVLILMFLFCLGFGLLVALISCMFRDLPHIIDVLFQMGFFLTPIVYTFEHLPGWLKPYMVFNPFFSFIEFFRSLVIDGTLHKTHLLFSVGFALFFLLVGFGAYQYLKFKVVEYV